MSQKGGGYMDSFFKKKLSSVVHGNRYSYKNDTPRDEGPGNKGIMDNNIVFHHEGGQHRAHLFKNAKIDLRLRNIPKIIEKLSSLRQELRTYNANIYQYLKYVREPITQIRYISYHLYVFLLIVEHDCRPELFTLTADLIYQKESSRFGKGKLLQLQKIDEMVKETMKKKNTAAHIHELEKMKSHKLDIALEEKITAAHKTTDIGIHSTMNLIKEINSSLKQLIGESGITHHGMTARPLFSYIYTLIEILLPIIHYCDIAYHRSVVMTTNLNRMVLTPKSPETKLLNKNVKYFRKKQNT